MSRKDMLTCPYCGTQNPDTAMACMRCGRQFVAQPQYQQQPVFQQYQPQQYPASQAPAQQPVPLVASYQQPMMAPAQAAIKPKMNMMLIITVLAVVVIVIVAVLAFVLLANSEPMRIESWYQSNNYFIITFTVTVKNYGDHIESATIECTAVIQSHTYTTSYTVTLDPQETRVVNPIIAIANPSDWGQTVQSATCVLV